MNFRKSCPTKPQRMLALALSAGFLSFLPGCALRDGSDLPENPPAQEIQAPVPSTAEMLKAAFGSDNPTLPPMIPDSAPESIVRPDIGGVLTTPRRTLNDGAAEWIALYGDKSADILLSPEEIDAYNRRIIDNCPTVVDIANPPAAMNGAEVRGMIQRYSMPSGERFTQSGDLIDSEIRQKIEARRENVPDTVTVRLAVITNRCDLKSLPASVGFHVYGDKHYSTIQESELITGFPVWILHESGDGQFYFVQSYYYAGWIPSDCAAVCTREEFDAFAQIRQKDYVTVTAPRLDVNGTRLDMGAVLPYLSENASGFVVSVPERNENGLLTLREEQLAKSDCTLGSLPYTAENTINQAFAFLGTPYGWGGADGNVDCSGFICAVFRCFGMYLPRNTGEQSLYNGEIVNLSAMTAEQKYQAFANLHHPSTVHSPGHVMLYLGEKNGRHYVIHAPKVGETVTVSALNMYNTYTCAVRIR